MAQIIEKDILDLTKDDLKYGKAVLMQQVNCQNEMDAGVAIAIDKLARKLFDVSTIDWYHQAWNQIFDNGSSQNVFARSLKFGAYNQAFNNGNFNQIKQAKKIYDTTDLPLYVVCGAFVFSFSQWNFGSDGKHYTNDQRLVNNIKTICLDGDISCGTPYERVYIPYKIGCGLGGGDWDYIYSQIKDIPNLVILKRKEDK